MSKRTAEPRVSRRAFVKAGTGAAAVAATGASGTALAQEAPYGGYLSDANNFDGTTIDMTGQSEVTIDVGAGNGIAFGPAAVQIDPGAKVTWKWTGNGGAHNVVAEDDSFNSGDTTAEAGHTFSQTFDSSGVVKYYCNPHKAAGMKGVVAVGDTAEGEVSSGSGGSGASGGESGGQSGGSGEGGGEGSGSPTAANDLALQTLLVMIVLGLLSPIIFLLIARRKMGTNPSS